MKFEFATATRIIFGQGTISEAAANAQAMGKRACVVTGSSVERAKVLTDKLEKNKIEYVTFSVTGEPTTTIAALGTGAARKNECDFVISFGGGSVLDTGKAIAAMLTNHGQLEDYLEVVGQGKPLANRAAPHIAIPTTAGTGAEVTKNSVLSVPEHQVKVSMRSPSMLPTLAIVDPVLTYSMSPYVTATTGLDALTQLIEALVSIKSNPVTDGICLEGITAAGRSLQKAYENGDDATARNNMSLASLFGGLALANAGLGAVHGFAGPLGGILSAPHGAICAALLPFVIEVNARALQARNPDSKSLERYNIVAKILTNNQNAKAEQAIEWIRNLCKTMQIPSLKKLGLEKKDIPIAAAKSRNSSSMKGNPIELKDDELVEILEKAFD
ncbi:MAG: iron-containing alcohol dehydrogenase [Sedimentisphaerales bacterium]|nr:iron-containing alcohol dehydrogenase [Sedimentisphaerales bacterium]